jgi:hypothetical protein
MLVVTLVNQKTSAAIGKLLTFGRTASTKASPILDTSSNNDDF